MGVLKTRNHIQILIKIQNPSQEPQASSKALNEDIKDMDVFCTFKTKIEGQNMEHGCIKDEWLHPNTFQDAKPQSGTSSNLQSPKWGSKGCGCSLHLQNHDRQQKFGTWVYQGPVTISKSRSRCQTPVKNFQHPPMPKMGGLKGQGCSLLLQTMIESQNMEYGRIKDKWLYPNQDQDAKPQSRTYSILQSPKWGIKGHGCCLQCKIKKERQNLEHGSIKDYLPYTN